MHSETRHPDDGVTRAIVGRTLQVHKAEHISLAGARTLLASVADAVARRHPAAVAEPVSLKLEPYFDRVLLEHRAGLLTQALAARKVMQAVTAVATGDAQALEAIRVPQE